MDKVQQRRNASQGGGWCHVKLGWQLPGSTFETPKKTCILWSNSIVVTWWPSSICHFGGTFSHQNFERSECFMDTPSPFASWNPSPLELSQQFFWHQAPPGFAYCFHSFDPDMARAMRCIVVVGLTLMATWRCRWLSSSWMGMLWFKAIPLWFMNFTYHIVTGWWFQTWLLFSISYVGSHPNPIDELIFFRGVVVRWYPGSKMIQGPSDLRSSIVL